LIGLGLHAIATLSGNSNRWLSYKFTPLVTPADTHDLRQAEGVLGIGLVDLERLDANHREANVFQLMEQSTRQLPAVESALNRMGACCFTADAQASGVQST